MPNILKSYFWWSAPERGSFHYDVMVTLILVFLFLSPRFIDFGDRPVETVALHSSEVLVKEAGQSDGNPRFIYQIRADMPGGHAGLARPSPKRDARHPPRSRADLLGEGFPRTRRARPRFHGMKSSPTTPGSYAAPVMRPGRANSASNP